MLGGRSYSNGGAKGRGSSGEEEEAGEVHFGRLNEMEF